MSNPDISPPPVIDPDLLVEALQAANWVKAGGVEGAHVLMAPHGAVIIPLDKSDPMYEQEMTAAVRKLRHVHGLRPDLLEGVVTPPDDEALP